MGFTAEEQGTECWLEPLGDEQKNPEDSQGFLPCLVKESHSGRFPDNATFSGCGIFAGILETHVYFLFFSQNVRKAQSTRGQMLSLEVQSP